MFVAVHLIIEMVPSCFRYSTSKKDLGYAVNLLTNKLVLKVQRRGENILVDGTLLLIISADMSRQLLFLN